MPTDSFTFAIGVSGDVNLAGFLSDFLEITQHVLFAFDCDVFGLEAVVDVNAEFLGGEVADVSDGSADGVVGAQVLADGFGFGW